ncbi:pentatricopeptide repeat-containing protein At1g63130, mitochondrial-like [Phalaenopsis equestris]|uniref:pentatricopeptide repeat-containing protein At1g63130, mitochondrial-like n=1 Tax=Phalaenopsis equestris TaxID=78828 RepID=UPI0009E21E29|nr:pentatricopeptide repeat-containing protein At1g63130, mitochondrial-like [Phalaenopsis equestris]
MAPPLSPMPATPTRRRTELRPPRRVSTNLPNASIIRATADPNSNPKQVLSLFTSAVRQRGFRHELPTYVSLLPYLVHHGRIRETELLLRRLPVAGLSPGPSLLFPLASSALAAGIPPDSAARLLLSASPSASAFSSLIGFIIRSNHLSLARSLLLFAAPDNLGFRIKNRHFAGLIRRFCRRGYVEEAEELVAEMGRRGVLADVEIWNFLLLTVCDNRSVDDGFQVYLAMTEMGVLPDVISFSTLMGRMGMEGKVFGCNSLFGRMLVMGVLPDLVFYRLLIRIYCNNCLLGDAVRVLRAMKIDGFLEDGGVGKKNVWECGGEIDGVASCADSFKDLSGMHVNMNI